MKLPAEGRVHDRITAIGTTAFPAYIVCGDEKTLMIDSGVNLLGPLHLASIRQLIGDEGRLDYLFLTHSHYDHIGSADYLERHLPGLQLGSHERVAALARKPSALERMNRLSDDHVGSRDDYAAGEDVALRPFRVDRLLQQGDEIDLGGLTCKVHEVPGHTRDSLAFYFPEIAALFPGEACGVLRTGENPQLQPEFVASFWDYVDSLKRLTVLQPRVICLPHNWVLTDDDAREIMERSLTETFRYRDLIERYLDAAEGDVEAAIQALALAEYDGDDPSLPPWAAFLANLSAQVKHIAEIRRGA